MLFYFLLVDRTDHRDEIVRGGAVQIVNASFLVGGARAGFELLDDLADGGDLLLGTINHQAFAGGFRNDGGGTRFLSFLLFFVKATEGRKQSGGGATLDFDHLQAARSAVGLLIEAGDDLLDLIEEIRRRYQDDALAGGFECESDFVQTGSALGLSGPDLLGDLNEL